MPCESMETVRFEEMHLDNAKDDFIESNFIKHVSFRNNSLTNISPKILNRVPGLICLDLSTNKFNLYNNNIIRHGSLRVLDLSTQNPEFTNWESKSEVEELEENKINIGVKTFNTADIYLPNLEYLILDGNYITSLPETFNTSFLRLSHLYLNNINYINGVTIDSKFFHVIPKTLRALFLQNNNISNLTLLNMTEITELYLDANPLQNIEIVSKKLRILSLSDGAAMGHIILHTPYLEYLDISNNNFYSDSNIRYNDLQFLKTVLLDYNKLSRFPLFVPDLSINKLSLSYNLLTHVTLKDFEHLQSLKMLLLRGNKIQNVENNAFKDLKHLELLDISQNQLIQLPNNWVVPLTNLHFLNVSSNFFTTFKDMAINSFSSVTHLFVEDNTFTKISTNDLMSLPKSITVYLD